MDHNQKDLLLSIHTQYAMQIVNGKKTIELRRKFPLFQKKDRKKIFIYACSPISKIIGECLLTEVIKLSSNKLWDVSEMLFMSEFQSFILSHSRLGTVTNS